MAKVNEGHPGSARRRHRLDEIDDTEGTAAYLGVPAKTLEAWRYLGKGPAFARVGKHVRYRRSHVDAWLDTQVVPPHSTDGRAA
jgi:excisionase family DNA binding protein